ncbi:MULTISPECIES: hypothetical protein [unclassified Arthrobacter]|uniref:hypothetical protein n=1 Tax=unclassified Arthrobacter TaxID=235627 RepID=UPI001D158454|nr:MULTISPECIES: hypothetical protein [unclassified Arthrobacter]
MTASFVRRTRVFSVVLASVVLLTACGTDKASEASPSKSATATPSASATSSASPSAPAPSATPTAAPVPTEAPAPAAPTVVTTPNGLHSFTLPAGWSAVPTEPLWVHPSCAPYVSPAAFTILDSTGNPVSEFYSGICTDGAATPSPGHVLYDATEIPAYKDMHRRPVYFQFESRPVHGGGRTYHVQLETGLPDAEGNDAGPQYGTVYMGDGAATFNALIEPGAFADDAAAQAWMQTDMYRQLKEMMLSLTYNG